MNHNKSIAALAKLGCRSDNLDAKRKGPGPSKYLYGWRVLLPYDQIGMKYILGYEYHLMALAKDIGGYLSAWTDSPGIGRSRAILLQAHRDDPRFTTLMRWHDLLNAMHSLIN